LLNSISMRRISLLAGGIALALAGGLSLTGCDQVTQNAKDAATSAATGAAQAALGPAVTPVLDLLKQSQSKVASIESAAQGLSGTFSKGTPSAADANTAISGLLGPLSALVRRWIPTAVVSSEPGNPAVRTRPS
jgi:hypothetical protein